MIEADKPSFLDKVVAFVLAVLAIGCSLALVKMGVVGLMGICR